MYSHVAGPKLWERTGLKPADIEVALMYDCFTYTVMATMEDYGFCEKGEVGKSFATGRATYGGDVVVNPHGGLLSEGYIHGLNHHYESTLQLRRRRRAPSEGCSARLGYRGRWPVRRCQCLQQGASMTNPVLMPPIPVPDPDSAPYWDALREGKLEICRYDDSHRGARRTRRLRISAIIDAELGVVRIRQRVELRVADLADSGYSIPMFEPLEA